eukprot:364897-Chlamydomonas_euryale.AAC.5
MSTAQRRPPRTSLENAAFSHSVSLRALNMRKWSGRSSGFVHEGTSPQLRCTQQSMRWVSPCGAAAEQPLRGSPCGSALTLCGSALEVPPLQGSPCRSVLAEQPLQVRPCGAALAGSCGAALAGSALAGQPLQALLLRGSPYRLGSCGAALAGSALAVHARQAGNLIALPKSQGVEEQTQCCSGFRSAWLRSTGRRSRTAQFAAWKGSCERKRALISTRPRHDYGM